MQQERIEQILVELGYNLMDRGKYWQTNAVYREGDNKTAIQIWKDTGTWRDFVANTKYLPFKKLVELSSKGDDAKISQILSDFRNNETFEFERKTSAKMEIDQFFDHDEVKSLLPHYSFYNKKQITDITLKLYKSGFSMSGKMNGRFVFPIFDEHGKVIGISGRHLLWKNDSTFPKWKHLGKKANWIYPINLPNNTNEASNPFVSTIEQKKEIILIEGIGDSLALSEQSIYNHLVVFGLELSSKQLSYLSSLSLEKIVISTNNDKDKDVNRGLQAAIKIFLKLINYFDIDKIEIKLPLKKDFGEMLESGTSIDEWINKKINKKTQIEYIIKHLYNNKSENNNGKIKLLKNYLEQLNVEGNIISEQNQDA